ncbi:FlgD-like protein [Propionicimonas paludicola]|uniref:FlgD-like protein n=1 Tax=Propionicimonas paludicola TaxID=185243 RepID=A0A2A9CNI7_9ACTN|nr:FlgD immunoglobulin-like domain containing protein [Propionicimonas paludicola]PFG15984.1 FlgD-like protein [Propionicimonas paludicola]
MHNIGKQTLRALVGGLTTFAMLVTLSPSTNAASDPRFSLPTQPNLIGIIAASGNNILARMDYALKISHDAGKTWSASAITAEAVDLEPYAVRDAKLVYANFSTLYVYDLASNTVTTTSVTDGGVRDATSTLYLDGSGETTVVRSMSTGSAVRNVNFTMPSWTEGSGMSLATDGSVVVQLSDGDEYRSYLVSKPDGTVKTLLGKTRVEADATLGNTVWWMTRSGSVATVCRRDISAAASSCATGSLGTSKRPGYVTLLPSTGGALIDVTWDETAGAKRQLKWFAFSGSSLKKAVDVKTGAWDVSVPNGGSQEKTLPILSAVDSKSSFLARLNANGSVTRLNPVSGTVQPVELVSLALSPTTVLGSDTRVTAATITGSQASTNWKRSVGSSVGTESALATLNGRATVLASAGRWAVAVAGKAVLYDGGKATTVTIPNSASAARLSGPYLLASDGRVFGTNGKWKVYDSDTRDLFGSLALIVSEDDHGKTTFTVRDLAGRLKDVTFSRTDVDGWQSQIWGDWIATAIRIGSGDDEVYATLLYNYRTKESKTFDGSLLALGDGVVATQDGDSVNAWRVEAGTKLELAVGNPVVTFDGGRLAYSSGGYDTQQEGLAGGEVTITRVSGAGASAPRVLGVVAASSFTSGSWSPKIDLTKPTKAGTLVIKDAKGVTVRTLTVKASADGSIRGVKWDGKNNSKKKVAKGSYTFWLEVAAADGSGTATRVDGSSGALGTVKRA